MDNEQMSIKDIINQIVGKALDDIKEKTGVSLDAKIKNKNIGFYLDKDCNRKNIKMFELSDIERIVTECLNMEPNCLKNKSRTRDIVDARTIYTHIARKYNFTVKTVGAHINRDHTTAIHHTKKAENLLTVDEIFAEKYNKVLNTIKEQYAKSI